jgi:hypothetical protein
MLVYEEEFTATASVPKGAIDLTGEYPVVRGVLLCGWESKSKRRYRPQAFKDAVRNSVYEDKPGYLGHHRGAGNPNPHGRLCWYENVREREDGLPIADMGFNPEHPNTKAILWEIKHQPHRVKLSHVADVTMVEAKDGWKDVVSIDDVKSVDVVSSGGTTNSIFEDSPVPLTLKQYAKKVGSFLDTKALVKLRDLIAEEDMGEMPMMDDAPGMEGEMTEDMGDGALDSAFMTAGTAALQECIDNKSVPDALKKMLKKVKKYFMAHGDLCDTDMEEEDPEETEEVVENKTAEEGAPKKKPVKGTTVQEESPDAAYGRFSRECVEEEFNPTPDLKFVVEGLSRLSTKEERIQGIRKLKGLTKATQPKSAHRDPSKAASETVTEEAPTDVKQASTPEQVRDLVRKMRAGGTSQPVKK